VAERSERARAIELVGPAAAGKSTLYRALAACSPHVRPGVPFGGLGHVRLGLRHGVRFLPAWLASRDRFFDEKEFRSLAYLVGWAEVLEATRADGTLAVFDHGPLFRLARLRAFGPRLVTSAAFERFAEAAIARWAKLLDAVVWLDAPDALLAARIEGRAERHRMQGSPSADTERFLARYRAGYEALLAELAAAGGPKPIRVDTSRERADAIAARLLDTL
jgi:hypothetical protein